MVIKIKDIDLKFWSERETIWTFLGSYWFIGTSTGNKINALGSSCLSVCLSGLSCLTKTDCYQSVIFVCVCNMWAFVDDPLDAVDRNSLHENLCMQHKINIAFP